MTTHGQPLRHLLAAGILAVWPLAGCAIVGPSLERAAQQSAIRKYGYTATPGGNPVLTAFYDLALAGGIEPAKTHVGFQMSPELKAMSAGKHHFLVATSILETRNPCLIWGMVAHEVAHDVLGHADRQVAASTGIGVVATAASFFLPGAGYLVQGAGSLGLRTYSRGQETDADAAAVGLLEEAGWPPWTLRYALEFVRDVYGDRGGSLLDTDPLLSERIAVQPPVDPVRAEELCGSAVARETQVGVARNRIDSSEPKPGKKRPPTRPEEVKPAEAPSRDTR